MREFMLMEMVTIYYQFSRMAQMDFMQEFGRIHQIQGCQELHMEVSKQTHLHSQV